MFAATSNSYSFSIYLSTRCWVLFILSFGCIRCSAENGPCFYRHVVVKCIKGSLSVFLSSLSLFYNVPSSSGLHHDLWCFSELQGRKIVMHGVSTLWTRRHTFFKLLWKQRLLCNGQYKCKATSHDIWVSEVPGCKLYFLYRHVLSNALFHQHIRFLVEYITNITRRAKKFFNLCHVYHFLFTASLRQNCMKRDCLYSKRGTLSILMFIMNFTACTFLLS